MHTLALLMVPKLSVTGAKSSRASQLFLSGIAVFSGSVYAFVLTEKKWLTYVTPFGGFMFISGWICMAYEYITDGSNKDGRDSDEENKLQ